MERLEDIFEKQRELQERLNIPQRTANNESLRQQYINQMAIAIHEETVEMLCSTRYKDPELVPFGWKKGQVFDADNFREEVIDLMHYVVNLALVAGITSQEFYELYLKKNKENHRRIDRGQRYETQKL